ncbi:unnamed protein product [Ceutorhynchus assimilis]|uniref:Major facilitator superfamily (MFS) profile domain-containing protein n=1 Tax=Ceutorhynchus assimilis TaxID=467358 RepID=A0A9P0DLR3_9CUCU|nr:unnamed protein product [Ceutorhynchus assimilis]
MKLLYLLFALDLLNLAVFLPVFNPFSRSLGGTPFTIGLINSCSALVSLLWNPIVGSLSDQVGRKSILIKCLTASSIGSIVLAFSSSLTMVFIGKMIGALGSPVGILLRSTVADIYKTAEEKKAFFNKCAPIMSVAFLVGSLSSGFLSEAKGGFSMAFLLMASIMGLGAALANQNLASDSKQTKDKSKPKLSLIQKGIGELKKAAQDIKSISKPHYRRLFTIKACYDFATAIILANLGLIMVNEFNITGRYMGYVFLMTSVISIIANIVNLRAHSILKRIALSRMLFIGGSILTISYIGLGVSISSKTSFLTFMCLMCFANAFMDTTLAEMATSEAKEEERGKVISACENMVQLAQIIVPVLSGSVAEIIEQRFIVLSATVPMVTLMVVANSKVKTN